MAQRWQGAFNLGQRAVLATTSQALSGCQSVLDVGCGTGSILEALPRLSHSVGLDAHVPALRASRERSVHDEYVEAHATEMPFADNSFDAVIMFDLIEHLVPSAGGAALREAERVARLRVVVFTPNGFVPQDGYDGNPLQVHRSGWSTADFEERGYVVSGMKGLRFLRGRLSEPRKPRVVTRPLLSASQLVVQRRPRHAYSLLAVKSHDGVAR